MKTDHLLVVTSYPPKGSTHNKDTVGVGSYTKNTLTSLPKHLAITVFAEHLAGEDSSYQENNIRVRRVWRRNSLATFFTLFFEIVKQKQTNDVLIAFELAMFGGMTQLMLFPLFLLILRLFRKRVMIICHHALVDSREISGHINLKPQDKRLVVLNVFIRLFNSTLVLLATKIIVFEEVFKKRLSAFGTSKKIVVIPHGVEAFINLPASDEARVKLNIAKDQYVVLYFGFLAWYKGVDWLVDTWKTQPDMRLIIAGGPNPNHLDKAYYRNFVADIEKKSKERHITMTGFIPEEEIPTYFQAADLIIFPYKTFMSASGPLSMAFSFQKPFLISDKLIDMFETADMKKIADEVGINPKDLSFPHGDRFLEKLARFKEDITVQKKCIDLSTKLAQARSWEKLGTQYYDTLFTR